LYWIVGQDSGFGVAWMNGPQNSGVSRYAGYDVGVVTVAS